MTTAAPTLQPPMVTGGDSDSSGAEGSSNVLAWAPKAMNEAGGSNHGSRPTLEEALACFGTTSVRKASRHIGRSCQRELQEKFQMVYGEPARSNNNVWLRKKLLEAIGGSMRYCDLMVGRKRPRKPKATAAAAAAGAGSAVAGTAAAGVAPGAGPAAKRLRQTPSPPASGNSSPRAEQGRGGGGGSPHSAQQEAVPSMEQPNSLVSQLPAALRMVAHAAGPAGAVPPAAVLDEGAAAEMGRECEALQAAVDASLAALLAQAQEQLAEQLVLPLPQCTPPQHRPMQQPGWHQQSLSAPAVLCSRSGHYMAQAAGLTAGPAALPAFPGEEALAACSSGELTATILPVGLSHSLYPAARRGLATRRSSLPLPSCPSYFTVKEEDPQEAWAASFAQGAAAAAAAAQVGAAAAGAAQSSGGDASRHVSMPAQVGAPAACRPGGKAALPAATPAALPEARAAQRSSDWVGQQEKPAAWGSFLPCLVDRGEDQEGFPRPLPRPRQGLGGGPAAVDGEWQLHSTAIAADAAAMGGGSKDACEGEGNSGELLYIASPSCTLMEEVEDDGDTCPCSHLFGCWWSLRL